MLICTVQFFAIFTPLRRAFLTSFLVSEKLVSYEAAAYPTVREGANAMNALTQQATTEGQFEQTTRVVVDAVRKAMKPLGKEAAQRVHSRGNELAAGIAKLVTELSVSDQYADEEVETSYNYPPQYRVKPLAEQIQTLAKLFSLNGAKALVYAEHLPELPEGAEGWFAVPRFEAVGNTYGDAVEKVIGLIAKSRKLKNWREGQLHERYLRQSERTQWMMAKLVEGQEGDILVIPAQFGFRHRGKSVRRARETFYDNEFGLGSFTVGAMLLTHPEREVEWEHLHIDCSGDEYSPGADGRFVYAPIFYWRDSELHFNGYWTIDANERCGSASGFLPQE